jgi:hypothetical protein
MTSDLFFRLLSPLRGLFVFCLDPTACAVGCVLLPLCGWSLLAHPVRHPMSLSAGVFSTIATFFDEFGTLVHISVSHHFSRTLLAMGHRLKPHAPQQIPPCSLCSLVGMTDFWHRSLLGLTTLLSIRALSVNLYSFDGVCGLL